MSIPYDVQSNRQRPDQVRLNMRCVSELQAEAIRRALRARFPWVSGLMGSLNPAYSHFLFVSTSVEALRGAWSAVEAEAETAVAGQHVGPASAQWATRRGTPELVELR